MCAVALCEESATSTCFVVRWKFTPLSCCVFSIYLIFWINNHVNEVCSSSQFHFFFHHHQLSFSVLHSFQLKFKLKYSLTYTSVHCVDFFYCSHVCYYFITMEEVDCQTASLSQYKIVALQRHSILCGGIGRIYTESSARRSRSIMKFIIYAIIPSHSHTGKFTASWQVTNLWHFNMVIYYSTIFPLFIFRCWPTVMITKTLWRHR